ncbi:MAG TPA: protein translocase subunit SecF, partial [Spirochaetota bacterium]|nr:protein translocase subunit SecF [Spirochaetota bacterium]
MKQLNIQFIKNRRWFYLVSLAMFVSFFSIAYVRGGINWGIDFVGGVKVVAEFDKGANIHDIRKTLDEKGIPNSVQQIASGDKNVYSVTGKLLKGDKTGVKTFETIKGSLGAKFSNVKIHSNETVGPAIGNYLRKSAWYMVLACILMMTVYLAFRFEFRFSLGAMVALLHDVILSIALAAAFQVEFDIPVLAAILTIFGYSVNDTIVIFDRIRERMHAGSTLPFAELMNSSINQTLSRTVITVFCTLLAVISLFF